MRAAILSDPVGDIVVMGHKNEYEQQQRCTDPNNDRNVQRVAFFGHCYNNPFTKKTPRVKKV